MAAQRREIVVRGDRNCFYRAVLRYGEVKTVIEKTGKSGEISPGQSNENYLIILWHNQNT